VSLSPCQCPCHLVSVPCRLVSVPCHLVSVPCHFVSVPCHLVSISLVILLVALVTLSVSLVTLSVTLVTLSVSPMSFWQWPLSPWSVSLVTLSASPLSFCQWPLSPFQCPLSPCQCPLSVTLPCLQLLFSNYSHKGVIGVHWNNLLRLATIKMLALYGHANFSQLVSCMYSLQFPTNGSVWCGPRSWGVKNNTWLWSIHSSTIFYLNHIKSVVKENGTKYSWDTRKLSLFAFHMINKIILTHKIVLQSN